MDITQNYQEVMNFCAITVMENSLVGKFVFLLKHLVELHPYKLTEEEKKEVKFHWIWDHFIAKTYTEAICKHCKVTIRHSGSIRTLKKHLKQYHK